MSAFTAELIGTLLLIVLGDGIVAGVLLTDSKAKDAGWIVITIGWGLAVAMAVYAVGSISGAHLNPAVTLGLAANEAFPWADVPMYLAAQFAGAFLGAGLVYLHYLPHWRRTEDADLKLAVFCTAPAVYRRWANLWSEAMGTFVLVMGILAIGANTFTEGLNPLIVGLLIVVIGMALGGTTGYAINPARDLGPRIAHFLLPIHGKRDSDWKYAWIPVVGPIVGGVAGATFFKAVFQGEPTGLFWGSMGALAVIVVAAVWEENQVA
ncbi:MAG: MIP/aquaporin family protein [Bacteroidota bacterium]